MTQLGEKIAFGTTPEEHWKCPFDHSPTPKAKKRESEMPKWDKNNAKLLGKNLTDEYHYKVPIKIKFRGKSHSAQYTPHHLIPGNASWPKTKLRKWVDKRSRHIKENIGYKVNAQYNGVSLPSWRGYPKDTGKSWESLSEWGKKHYAIAAMKATPTKRQFHDSHPDYNDFVTGVLDKIAEKLDSKTRNNGYAGCGKKHCTGNSSKKKPYDPPIHLLERLKAVALRLESYLTGSPRSWRKPIFTSRFARIYKQTYRG